MGHTRHPLIRSEAAARILALLTAVPGEELHTNEIMRRTETNPNAAQRALERLESGGVLKSRRLGNLRLWSIARDHPLFASLRDLFGRTRGIPMLLKTKLSADPRIALAFLFGSYVTSQDDPSSDIDLFVVGESSPETLEKVTEEVARQLRRQLNVVAWSPQDLTSPTPAQRAFLETIKSRPKIGLIGDEDEFDRRRRRVGAAVDRSRRADTRKLRRRPATNSPGRAKRAATSARTRPTR